MDCRTIRRDVPALLDGDLGPRRAGEVLRHLDSCPNCDGERAQFQALLRASEDALSYRGAPLAFNDLRARMATTEPLDQVLRYQLPKLKIPGTAPRFAVAMVLLVCLAGPTYACRHSRQVYTAAKSPFEYQEATLTAALDDGRFPWDEVRGDEAEGDDASREA